MRQTGVTPMMTSPERPAGSARAMKMNTFGASQDTPGGVAERAMGVASQVQNLGFVEFHWFDQRHL